MEKNFILKNEDEMCHFAKKLASLFKGGAFIALFGDLGAGKTTFVRYFASALGIDNISSPTFNIVKSYAFDGGTLAHFDCYRLSSSDELYAMGFEDHLLSSSIVLMEWSENVTDALPSERLEIRIHGSGADERRLEVISFGSKYERIAGEML